jgi:peptide/nickel transport system permease protein
VSNYIIKRVAQLVIVLFIVTVLVFGMMRILPGDPIRMLLSSETQSGYTEAQVQALRHANGLDRNYVVQYVSWMGGVFKGDLGKSISYGTPVRDAILSALPITLEIGLLGWIIGTLLGVSAGVLCAMKRGTSVDTVITALANAGTMVPIFWLALVLMYIFGVKLHWLPVGGWVSPFVDFGGNLRDIVMPVMCLALFPMASIARQTRSAMLGVLHQDYIRTAWSKGLQQRVVVVKHALRNSLIPIVTMSGMVLGGVVGGAVFEETIFGIPGMGQLTVTSVNSQDYPYIQGITLLVAFVVLVVNLLVDISYGWLDPRIRYS